MKSTKKIAILLPSLICVLFFMGCQRSKSEVWEDTKTAGRYANKGFWSLLGKDGESREISSHQEFAGPPEEDFIPLRDEDVYNRLALGDQSVLETITEDSSIPQSREAPGESGSDLPSISGFKDPNALNVSNIFNTIHFSLNQASIQGGQNSMIIDNIAQYLKKHPNVYLFIEGHTCERGTSAYNLALGTRRANSVRNLLIKNGVDMNRIFTISYGKERPVAMGNDEASLKLNRRAEFKLYTR
ncbi:MAG: OmpA family protein [Chlamydiota bacterium]